jgi:PST family polysaccharide transporter
LPEATSARGQGPPAPSRADVRLAALSVIVTIGCAFVAIVVLARQLTPADLGIAALALAVAGAPALLHDSALRAVVVERREGVTRAGDAAALWALGAGFLLAAFCIAGALAAGALLDDDTVAGVLASLAPVVLVRTVAVVPQAVLERRGLRARLAAVRISSAVLGVWVMAILAGLDAGAWSAVGGLAVLAGWQAILAPALCPVPPHPFRSSVRSVRRLLPEGRRRLAGNAAGIATACVDAVVVGRVFGLAALGSYGIGLHTGNALGGNGEVPEAVEPGLASTGNAPGRLRERYLRALRRVSVVALPAAAAVAVLSHEITLVVFGERWADAAPVLAILALQALVVAPAGAAAAVLRAPGRRRLGLRIGLIQLVVVVDLMILLYRFGVDGIAGARAIGAAGAGVVCLVLAAHALGLPRLTWVAVMLRPAAAAGVVGGGLAATRWALDGRVDTATGPMLLALAVEAAALAALVMRLPAPARGVRPAPASEAPAADEDAPAPRRRFGRRPRSGERASYRQGLAVSVIGFAALGVFAVVSSIVIARVYGIEVVGEAALVMAPTLVMIALSSVGEQSGLIRHLAVLKARDPKVTGVWTATFAFSFALTAAVLLPVIGVTYLVFQGPFDRPDLFMPALVQLLGYLFVTNTCWNLDMLLSSFRAAGALFWVRLSQAVAFLAVAVALGLEGPSVWGLVFATIAGWSVSLLHRLPYAATYMAFRVRRADMREGTQALPDIIGFGIRTAPGALFTGIGQQIGTWVLGAVAPITAVGAFDRANVLTDRFRELGYRIVEMLYPTMVERRAQGDGEGVTRSFVDSIRYTLVFMLLVAGVGGGVSDGIMDLFGSGFDQGARALSLLLLATGLAIVSMTQGAAMMSLERPLLTTWISAARLLVTVPLMVALAPAFGPTGAAAAVLSGQVVATVAAQSWLVRHLPTRVSALWSVREMAALGIAAAAGFVAARLAEGQVGGLGGLISGLVLGSAAYIVAFTAAGGLNERDRSRMTSVLDVVRGRRALAGAPDPS